MELFQQLTIQKQWWTDLGGDRRMRNQIGDLWKGEEKYWKQRARVKWLTHGYIKKTNDSI